MKILFIGDIYGKCGRQTLKQYLPPLKEKYATDFVIANVDNAAHGFGVTAEIAQNLLDFGVDALTGGDHIWNQRDIISFIDQEPRLLRPHNMPENSPGQGFHILEKNGKKLLLIHLLGRVFMDPTDDPFLCIKKLLERYTLKKNVDAIFVDFHAEATSETMVMGQYFDGQVSAVVGTHTHIQTADDRILTQGTAYMTDVGMTGDYDSIVGAEKTEPFNRFIKKMNLGRLQPANGDGTLCGVIVETNETTGLAKTITPIRAGGHLKQTG